MVSEVSIYSDGGCWPNPGRGGWAAIIVRDGVETELSGFDPMTTNNRMELLAMAEGIEAVEGSSIIMAYSDSQYVIKGMSVWIAAWKKRGWTTGKGRKKVGRQWITSAPVKNQDLWVRLDEAASKHAITWNWVRGHDGHHFNERCDVLAAKAMEVGALRLREGA